MIKRLTLVTAILTVAAFVMAQTTLTILPTTAPNDADAIAMGATSASVNQDVRLILPQATALHLDASTITFDLTNLSTEWDRRAQGLNTFSAADVPYKCVYSAGPDVTQGSPSGFWGQTQTIPGGIAYEAVYDDYPAITITGEEVWNYPPLKLEGGELVPGSKDHIVCYQSFIIQLFSNFGFWDLQVSRNDITDDDYRSIEHLYVQGNVCSTFGQGTGLYALGDGDTVHLIPTTLNAGTTGDKVNENCHPEGIVNSSWLDVLGVLAVKINSDFHGESRANLTYTLVSSDTNW